MEAARRRPNRSAAERRAQAQRAEARFLARVLRLVRSPAHRGFADGALREQLRATLGAETGEANNVVQTVGARADPQFTMDLATSGAEGTPAVGSEVVPMLDVPGGQDDALAAEETVTEAVPAVKQLSARRRIVMASSGSHSASGAGVETGQIGVVEQETGAAASTRACRVPDRTVVGQSTASEQMRTEMPDQRQSNALEDGVTVAAQMDVEVGCRVRLAGLVRHPDLNGMVGTVVAARVVGCSQRYHILLSNGQDSWLQSKHIRRVDQG